MTKRTHILKGIAIISVVILHVISSIKQPIFFNQWQSITLTLDQINRFCVPLFVAVSGYGLMKSSQGKKINLGKFIRKRSSKLLPLYFLWCILIILAIFITPIWQWSGFASGWIGKFIFGWADYHLYFVPMIFQLYILFPVFRWMVRKSWFFTLILAFIWHGVWLLTINEPGFAQFIGVPEFTDQMQYVFFGTWSWYFILGMAIVRFNVLKYSKKHKKRSRLFLQGIYVLIIVSLFWSIFQGIKQLNNGVDPIFITKFTRIPISVYASGVVLLALFWLEKKNTIIFNTEFRVVGSIFTLLGIYSYIIYLSHTLALRMIFSYGYQKLTLSGLIAPILVFVFGWMFSLSLLSKNNKRKILKKR